MKDYPSRWPGVTGFGRFIQFLVQLLSNVCPISAAAPVELRHPLEFPDHFPFDPATKRPHFVCDSDNTSHNSNDFPLDLTTHWAEIVPAGRSVTSDSRGSVGFLNYIIQHVFVLGNIL